MNEEIAKNILKSNTSIVGIVCKDGIVMGADRRTTAGGSLVMSKNTQKIRSINEYIIASYTGNSSDIAMTNRIIAAELRLKELRDKDRPTVEEAANFLGMITYRNIRQPSMIASVVGTLLAGFNEDGSTELYTIEPA